MIVVFLLIDLIYRKVSFKRDIVFSTDSQTIPKYFESNLSVPQNIFFGKGHTWANLRQSGRVQIGIDDFARKFIGNIEKISIKAVGHEIRKGDTLLTIESKGKKFSFTSPISGTIYSFNVNAIDDPQIMNSNPYDKSWLCAIQPKNLSYELKLMKVADEAVKWIQVEVARLKDFLADVNLKNKLVGATLQDGGIPVIGVMESLDSESCQKFEKEFLSE
jgi:glycine cleavage system H protein